MLTQFTRSKGMRRFINVLFVVTRLGLRALEPGLDCDLDGTARHLDLCRVHGVEIDPAMATLVLSVLVLEGLGRSLDPTFNVMDFAMPFVLGRGKV